jgi:hypothetical protein
MGSNEADHDKFAGWYDGDRVSGLSRMKERIERAITDLGGGDGGKAGNSVCSSGSKSLP